MIRKNVKKQVKSIDNRRNYERNDRNTKKIIKKADKYSGNQEKKKYQTRKITHYSRCY
jgi:hypothetical protein